MARPRFTSPDMRDFMKAIEKEGWKFAGVTRGVHIKVIHPETGAVSFLPQSASDHRSLKNCLSGMRRSVRQRREQKVAGGKG